MILILIPEYNCKNMITIRASNLSISIGFSVSLNAVDCRTGPGQGLRGSNTHPQSGSDSFSCQISPRGPFDPIVAASQLTVRTYILQLNPLMIVTYRRLASKEKRRRRRRKRKRSKSRKGGQVSLIPLYRASCYSARTCVPKKIYCSKESKACPLSFSLPPYTYN